MLKIAKTTDTSADGLELDRAILLLDEAKKAALAAQTLVEDRQAEVIDLLRLYGAKSHLTNGVTKRYKATLVEASTVKYNEVGLKKALGAALWKKVIKTSLDKAKLEQLVSSGEIDVHVVAEHSTVSPNKPYVRISTVDEDAEG